MSDRIDPKTPSGFRDLLPKDAEARQKMMDRTAGVFRLFGFSPIDTPALERLDVLTGGDPEFKKQLYRARITDDDEPLGLRFDLTVPLARYVAAHADKLQMPFMRFHIGKMWRGEHAQKGRYREFIQCDADIVGAASVAADAQVLAAAYAVMNELGLGSNVLIRLSNRKLLNGLAEFLEFPAEKTPLVLRAIDKIEKQGWDDVAAELKEKAGLDAQQIDAIQEFLALKAETPEALLDKVHAMMEFAPQAHAGLEELRELAQYLDALKVPRSAWELDLSIARGFGYYTGTVFETKLLDAPEYGSICSGGRYDDLVSKFAPMKLPGVGISLGVDRLFAALDELGLIADGAAPAKIAVLNFEPTCRHAVMTLASELRAAGVATQLYLGHEETLKGQLAWAVKAGFPYVAIIGATEHKKGAVQLKDMVARTQQEVPLADLPAALR